MIVLKELFFKESLRHWHFEELVRQSKLSRERVNVFLKALMKKGVILRIKPVRKMPFYVANRENAHFRAEKKLYGLKLLENSGLIEHLSSLEGVKTAIIFGSFARGDWNKSSDVDIFLFGNGNEFEKGMFEKKLQREIQLFSFDDAENMKRELDQKLFSNIVKGFNIKESLEPFEVRIHA